MSAIEKIRKMHCKKCIYYIKIGDSGFCYRPDGAYFTTHLMKLLCFNKIKKER